MTSQFGIVVSGEPQQLEGRTVRFEPNHSACDLCWSAADSAYAMACLYGESFASESRRGDAHDHGIYAKVAEVTA